MDDLREIGVAVYADEVDVGLVDGFVVAAGAVIIAHIDHILVAQPVIAAIFIQSIIF